MDLSVIIVSYKNPELLEKSLSSLLQHSRFLSAEIIVIDNDSGDASPQVARSFEGVIVEESGANLGFAGGVNLGLKRARGRYVLVLNPDVEVAPGALETLIRFMDDHPQTGLAGPKLLNSDGTLQHSCRRFYTLKTILLRRTFLGKLFPKARDLREHLMLDYDHREPRIVDWVAGAAMIVRREAVRDVGPMDDRYFLYFEDVDWCRRMHAQGWDVHYVPESVMTHEWQRASSGFSSTTGIHIRSGLKFYERWGVLSYLLRWYHNPLRVAGLVVVDSMAMVAAFLIAYQGRQGLAFLLQKPLWPLSFYVSFLTTSLAVFLLTFASLGLYKQVRQGDWVDVAFDVAKGSTLALVIVMAATFMLDMQGFSRVLVFGSWPIVMVLTFLNRRAIFATFQRAQKERLNLRRFAVLGDDPGLQAAVARLEQDPDTQYEFVRVALREPGDLVATLARERAVGVLASPQAFESPEHLETVIRSLRRAGFDVHVTAPFLTALPRQVVLEKEHGVGWLSLVKPTLRPAGIPKRFLDIVLSLLLGFVCFVPALLGRFRRRYSWYTRLGQVIRGRMSLVGPRPDGNAADNPAWAKMRAGYRPGVTGLWSTDPCATPQQETQQELEYIEEWSVEKDLKILVRAFLKGGKGPLVCLLLVFAPGAWAQSFGEAVTPFVNAYNMQELVQGDDGGLWIASNGGGLRFDVDTNQWESYPRLQTGGPAGNDCVTVSKGGDGLLWFGSGTRGVSSLDTQLDRWTFFEEVTSLETRVVRAHGDQLFIGTQAGLSLRFTAIRTDICNDINPACVVPSYVVNDFAKIGDSLWVATQEGLGLHDGTGWVELDQLPSAGRNADVSSLATFQGTLWMMIEGGLYSLEETTLVPAGVTGKRLKLSSGNLYVLRGQTVVKRDAQGWVELGEVPLPSGATGIRDLEEVGGRLFVTTDRGLVRWVGGESTAAFFLPPGPAVAGFHNGLTVDRNGVVWVVNREGLMSYRETEWSFLSRGSGGLDGEWAFEVITAGEELAVGHCCCDADPRCSTDLGDGKQFESADVYDAWALAFDGKWIWAGTNDSGAFVLENTGGQWEVRAQFNTANSSMGSNIIPAVAADADEAWFGHQSDGISYWRHSGDLVGGFWNVIDSGSGLLDNSVNTLLKDGKDLWAGTATGIHRIQGQIVLESRRTVLAGVAGDRPRAVRAIVVDKTGNLWLGTSDGVLIQERGQFEFRHLTTKNSSLPSDNVLSGALNPRDGSVWFGCDEGVVRFDPGKVLGVDPGSNSFAVYPNPFDPLEGSVSFVDVSSGSPSVPAFDPGTPVDVLDISGNVVSSFVYDGGWTWDGLNPTGQPVVPGLYIVRARPSGREPVLLKLGVVR